ncbi:MAG: hypothetical protein ABSF91_07655 [Bacteroidota bacterium]|jgi:hypothetical protein
MNKNKVVIVYLLMLMNHVAHIFEETWGRFWLIDSFYGLGWFLVANWVLLCIPVVLFYFVLHERRWAHHLSIIYAGIMILNGVGHNIATIVTGRYFGGFAGGYTGIGLIIIGSAMIYYLLKAFRSSGSW